MTKTLGFSIENQMKNHQDSAAESNEINNRQDSVVESTTWTNEEDTLFKRALVFIPVDDPERWQKMADAVPGKTAEQVRIHNEKFVKALDEIEACPWDHLLPPYADDSDTEDCDSQLRTSQTSKDGDGMEKGTFWTADEHRRFLEGLIVYGRGNWQNISRNCVITKTPVQVASHAQKFFQRQQLGKNDRKRSSINDITTTDTTNLPGGEQHSAVQNDQDSAVESTWTSEEDTLFTSTLAEVPVHDPGRWQKIADAVPGKTAEQVRVHYEKLVQELEEIVEGEWGYASPPYVDDTDTELTTSQRSKPGERGKKKWTPWTDDEHMRFLRGVNVCGRGDWSNISRKYVITRTPTQVANHAHKFFGKKDRKKSSILDITTMVLPTNISNLQGGGGRRQGGRGRGE